MATLNKIGALFPRINNSVASYDPATFFISLDTMTEAELHEMRGKPNLLANVENYKTLLHEVRHSIDHISTLWGQRNLLLFIDALNARLTNDLKRFDRIIQYKLAEKQLFFSEYFTEVINTPVQSFSMDKRWKWSATSGLRFSSDGLSDENRPIPMITFKTFEDLPLTRVPLSVASLLETNAIYVEMRFHALNILMQPESSWPLLKEKFSHMYLSGVVYNQKHVLYNVAVHLTSNLLKISDTYQAFEISSTIATLTLNLPHTLVTKLPIDEKAFGAWGQRSQKMLDNHDYGFIFYVLLTNYKKVFSADKLFDLNDVLSASNLPAYPELERMILAEFDLISQQIKENEYFRSHFSRRARIGRDIVSRSGIAFERNGWEETLANKELTLMINCTDTALALRRYSLPEMMAIARKEQLTNSEWYNIVWHLNAKMDELFAVRGL